MKSCSPVRLDAGSPVDGGAATESQACIDYLSCAATSVPSEVPTLTAMFGPHQHCVAATGLAGPVYAAGTTSVSGASGFSVNRYSDVTGNGLRLTWFSPGQPVYGSVYSTDQFSITVGCHYSCKWNAEAYDSGAPYPIGSNNNVSGWRLDFESDNPGSQTEGMDIAVSPTATVYFDLYVAAKHQPTLVVFDDATTNQSASPTAIPFGLRQQ